LRNPYKANLSIIYEVFPTKVVYKKYIWVNGKRYGPYLYHNKRVGQKIITSYYGSSKSEEKDFGYLNYFLIIGFLLLVIIGGFLVGQRDLLRFLSPDERIIFNLPDNFVSGELLRGEIIINLQRGELIPVETIVHGSLREQNNNLILREIVDLESVEGDFFIDGYGLSGSGEGFGIIGEKPGEVIFQLEIFSEEKSPTIEDETTSPADFPEEIVDEADDEEVIDEEIVNETADGEKIVEEETTDETPVAEEEETVEEASIEEVEKVVDKEVTEDGVSGEEKVEESATGEVVSEGSDAGLSPPRIIEGIVNADEPYVLKLNEDESARLISGSVKSKGEKLEDDVISLEAGENEITATTNYVLDCFGQECLTDEELEIKIDISEFGFVADEDKLEVSFAYNGVELFEESKNIVLEKVEEVKDETNETEKIPEVNITIPDINETITMNKSDNLTIITIQPKVIVGQEFVDWEIEVSDLTDENEVTLQIPESAIEIIVNRINENGEEEEDEIIEENVEDNLDKEILLSPPIVSKGKEVKVDVINKKGFKLRYKTPGPDKTEEEIENGKKVRINSDVHYENVEAFTAHPQPGKQVKIFWVEENKYLNWWLMRGEIHWIVPHTSNQTFNIIVITKAEHLDSNRNFISDIYDEVKELDGIWSETISNGDYVRVTFEKNLTNENDITIWPRIVSGTPRIEVYEVDGNEIIAEFTLLNDDEYNKVFLTNLGQGQCYDNKTEILTDDGWKYFYELEDEKAATLNQETGELEWEEPSDKQVFEHDGEMYRIEMGDGSELLVSPKHRVYVSTSTLSSLRTNSLPLISFSEKVLSNFNNADSSINNVGGCMRITITPEESFGGNNDVFKKCLSCVNNTLLSLIAKENSLESLSPLGPYFVSKPFSIKNLTTRDLMFSSVKNFILFKLFEQNNSLVGDSLCSETQCGVDVCFGEGGVIYKDFFNCFSTLQHLQNLPDHDSGAFKSWSSSANLSICNDILIDFDSHEIDSGGEVYKDFDLIPIVEVYESINSGKEVYFLDAEGNKIKVNSIIKENYSGKIYDVDVENDIVLVRRIDENDNEKIKRGSNGMEPNRLIPDYNMIINSKYLNVSKNINAKLINKENKGVKNVTPTVRNFSLDDDSNNDNMYINFSDNSNVEDAALIPTVRNRSETSGLFPRQLGSTPGRSASTHYSKSEEIDLGKIDLTKAFWSGNSDGYSQDTFDLKIVGGSVEFEHVVDPIGDSCTTGDECGADICIDENGPVPGGGFCRSDCVGNYGRDCSKDGSLLSTNPGTCSIDAPGFCDYINPVRMDCSLGLAFCEIGTDITYDVCTIDGGDSCDSTAGGDFLQEGICASDGVNPVCDNLNEVAFNAVTYYTTCTDTWQCDFSTTDTGDYFRDGYCCGGCKQDRTVLVGDACCGISEVCETNICGSDNTCKQENGGSCDTGNECGSGICISGTCESTVSSCNNAGNNGLGCSTNGAIWSTSAAGTCVSNAGGMCDYVNPVRMDCSLGFAFCEIGTDITYDACPTTSGDSCDGTAGGNFVQNGICASGGANNCDTSGHVCVNSVGNYESTCGTCYDTATARVCDRTLDNGDFLADGICVSPATCDFDDIARNCKSWQSCSSGSFDYYPDCVGASGDHNVCDSDASDGAYASDGVCITNNCVTGLAVCDILNVNCFNGVTGGTLGTTCVSGSYCDGVVNDNSNGYVRDGYCSGVSCNICEVGGESNCVDFLDNDCDGTVDNNCVDGQSCTTGNDCASSLCIDEGSGGFCRSDCTTFNNYGKSCSKDASALGTGTCSSDAPGFCDYINPVRMDCVDQTCALGETTYDVCGFTAATGGGDSCDATAGGDFVQGGICAFGAQDNCDISGHVCLDSGEYRNECFFCYSPITARVCDRTLTDGDFLADGVCVAPATCDFDEVARNCLSGVSSCGAASFYPDCSNANAGDNKQCDSDVSDGAYTSDGVCITNNCEIGLAVCSTGDVNCNDGSGVLGITCFGVDGFGCDSDVGTLGYERDGTCVLGSCITNTGFIVASGSDVIIDPECGALCSSFNPPNGYDFTDGDEVSSCILNEGQVCDNTPSTGPTAEGICADGVCDINTVRVNCGTDGCASADLTDVKIFASCDTISGDACDSNVETNGFVQDGICADEVSGDNCDTSGHVCIGSIGDYSFTCGACYSSTTARVCDRTLTNGDFLADGVCVASATCDFDEVARNCLSGITCGGIDGFYPDCSDASVGNNKQCDSDVSDGAYTTDGVCITNNCEIGLAVCSTGDVNCGAGTLSTTCAAGRSCDLDVESIGYERSGYCAQTVCCNAHFASGEVSGGTETWESGNENCGCTDREHQICDSSPQSGPIANGVCTSSNFNCETGPVACGIGSPDCSPFSPGTLFNTCAIGMSCDSVIGDNGYERDGYCAQTTCANVVITADVSADGTECGALCSGGGSFTDGNEGNACTSSNAGSICSTTPGIGFPPIADGVCVDVNLCDSSTVSVNCGTDGCTSGDLTEATMLSNCDSILGNACESGSIGTNGFNQEGICGNNGATDVCIDSGAFVFFDDVNPPNYRAESFAIPGYYTYDLGLAQTLDGFSCDTTLTNGDYLANGMIVYDGVGDEICVSGSVYCDGGTNPNCETGDFFRSGCTNGLGNMCDSSIAASLTAPFVADGVCVSGNSCDIDEVALDAGTYYPSCVGHDTAGCDSEVGALGYVRDGTCDAGSCVVNNAPTIEKFLGVIEQPEDTNGATPIGTIQGDAEPPEGSSGTVDVRFRFVVKDLACEGGGTCSDLPSGAGILEGNNLIVTFTEPVNENTPGINTVSAVDGDCFATSCVDNILCNDQSGVTQEILYTCDVAMNFFDPPSPNGGATANDRWTISATIQDSIGGSDTKTSGDVGFTATTCFSGDDDCDYIIYNQITAVTAGGILVWDNLDITQEDNPANDNLNEPDDDPLVLNNAGNIDVNSVSIVGRHLTGVTNTGAIMSVDAFSADGIVGGVNSGACDNTGTAKQLVHGSLETVPIFISYSANGLDQSNLFFCIWAALNSQTDCSGPCLYDGSDIDYSATEAKGNNWEILFNINI